MPTIEYDLRYIRAALVDLEGYLLSKELYWPIGIRPPQNDPPYPRLTLGGILISRQSLKGRSMDADQKKEYANLSGRIDETRTRWRAAWGTKAAREFTSRLAQWNNFIDDYRKQSENNTDRYAYEARGRVMLQLMEPESDEIRPAELEMVRGLDRILQVRLLDGSFVWDTQLSPSFPRSQFWYLYGRLSKSLPIK